MKNKEIKKLKNGGLLLLLGAALAAALLGLCFGSTRLSPTALWQGDETAQIILLHLRLPRVLGGLLAGAGLSVAGLLLQAVTGNELAGPNIIGVNAGAGFAAILTLFLAPSLALLLPISAFFGAFFATLLILAVADRIQKGRATVVLAGVAVSALLNAGISLLSLLDTDVLAAYNHFSIGGLAGVQLSALWLPALLIGGCLLAALLLAKELDLLCLGGDLAAALGTRVRRVRLIALILASASAAAAVSFAGLLGFIGLVVPHMARRLFSGIRRQLLGSALLGGSLVTLADLLGRLLFAPSELPVGILMAAIGAPFFFYLLARRDPYGA